MALEPGGLLAWLVVGLIAGLVASHFLRGPGFEPVGDLVVSIVGAIIGGLLFRLVLPGSSAGLVGSIVVAFIGALVLITVVGAVAPRPRFGL